MRLYLVRHAHAAPGEPDELRALTPEGRRDARSLGELLAAEGVRPDAILSSPLLRARETAEELGRATGVQASSDERLGPGAEWLTAGRARREALRVAYRLVLRERLLDGADATADVIAALGDRAEELADAVCPDYSYLQPAQVTSFGHYLLSFAGPHLRNLERFRAAYKRVNRSPAGVGPVAGSRFRFDRTRSAHRLGFDGPVTLSADTGDITLGTAGDVFSGIDTGTGNLVRIQATTGAINQLSEGAVTASTVTGSR